MVIKGTRFIPRILCSREQITDLYINGQSMYKIATLCKCSPQAILFHLKQAGIKSRSLSDSSTTYSHNRSFFKDINSEESAYFLGLLYADGNVYHNVVSITLQITDRELIDKLKDVLQYTGPIYTIAPKNKIKSIQSKLGITSTNLTNDLAYQGLTPNKGFTLKFPSTVPPHLIHHFIRGYFDGDGCIYSRPSKQDYLFSIVSTLEFLQDTQRHLVTATGLNFTKLYNPPKMRGKNLYILTYQGGNSVRKIRDWLYKDSTIFLSRKHDKFFSI